MPDGAWLTRAWANAEKKILEKWFGNSEIPEVYMPDSRVDGTASAAHLFLGNFGNGDHRTNNVLARDLPTLDIRKDSCSMDIRIC